MAFNGSGVFSRLYNWATDRDASIKIRADRMDAEMDGFATGLSNALCKDGQQTSTANQPMGGFKHTNVADATARNHYLAAGQLQDGECIWVDGGGTADAITATYTPAITAVVDGMLLGVRATAANATTTPTFAPNGLTARTIVKDNGQALVAGDIAGDGHDLLLRYDATNTRWLLLNPATSVKISNALMTTRGDIITRGASAPQRLALGTTGKALVSDGTDPGWGEVGNNGLDKSLFRSYLAGLGMSQAADTDHDITIAVGVAMAADQSAFMELGSAITKQIDAAWAVGSAAGGMDTGSVANNTWYHVWLIRRSDTGVVDALFSTSASSPTMPTNYDQKRRIGSVKTDGSANIIGFVQVGDEFLWKVPVSDLNETNPGNTADLRTLTVPTGISVYAILAIILKGGTTTTNHLLVTHPSQTDSAASATLFTLSTDASAPGSEIYSDSIYGRFATDTSAQIRTRLTSSGASDVLRITTHGWVDRRGRDD